MKAKILPSEVALDLTVENMDDDLRILNYLKELVKICEIEENIFKKTLKLLEETAEDLKNLTDDEYEEKSENSENLTDDEYEETDEDSENLTDDEYEETNEDSKSLTDDDHEKISKILKDLIDNIHEETQIKRNCIKYAIQLEHELYRKKKQSIELNLIKNFLKIIKKAKEKYEKNIKENRYDYSVDICNKIKFLNSYNNDIYAYIDSIKKIRNLKSILAEIDVTVKFINKGSENYVSKVVIDETQYAMGFPVDKNRFNTHQEILKKISLIEHPNILKFFGWRFREHIEIFEYCNKGDFFDFLAGNFFDYNALNVSKFFDSMIGGLSVLHDAGIAHMDIKLENILVSQDESGEIVYKIGDFGFSTTKEISSQLCGTTTYLAPEIINEPYNTKKSDIWSLGKILLYLFTGKLIESYFCYKQAINDNIANSAYSQQTQTSPMKNNKILHNYFDYIEQYSSYVLDYIYGLKILEPIVKFVNFNKALKLFHSMLDTNPNSRSDIKKISNINKEIWKFNENEYDAVQSSNIMVYKYKDYHNDENMNENSQNMYGKNINQKRIKTTSNIGTPLNSI